MARRTQSHATSYLEEVLTPTQMKRITRKTTKAKTQVRKNSTVPENVVELFNQEKREMRPLVAKTKRQAELIKMMQQKEQVFVTGPAGVGKTYVVACFAAQMFNKGQIKKIVLTRPNVPAGRTLGLFPGSVEEKCEVWFGPIINTLKEMLGAGVYEIALKRGDIIYAPLETIRGASFENAFIIVDEAQNLNIQEMKAVVTRVGEGSQIVLDGDINQLDIPERSSGLLMALKVIAKSSKLSEMTGVVQFDSNDIVRSGLVREWIVAFEEQNV